MRKRKQQQVKNKTLKSWSGVNQLPIFNLNLTRAFTLNYWLGGLWISGKMTKGLYLPLLFVYGNKICTVPTCSAISIEIRKSIYFISLNIYFFCDLSCCSFLSFAVHWSKTPVNTQQHRLKNYYFSALLYFYLIFLIPPPFVFIIGREKNKNKNLPLSGTTFFFLVLLFVKF